jgi:hypothetical protein
MSFTNMSEVECERRSGTYIPPTHADWGYNELRTLRMEYETLEFLKNDFSTAISRNLSQGAKQFSWQDLAGTATWDRASGRIGSQAELPIQAVLQEFNAARDEEKLDVLNAWLADRRLPTIPELTKGHLEHSDQADVARSNNLEWIPMNAEMEFHILLPAPVGIESTID